MRIEASWQDLSREAARLIDTSLGELLVQDPRRAQEMALRVGPLYANFSRQRVDRQALEMLYGMAASAGVPAALRAMFDGEPVNGSERRAALHTALRSPLGQGPVAAAARSEVAAALDSMRTLIDKLRASGVTDVVNVGIGGSDLGPRLAV